MAKGMADHLDRNLKDRVIYTYRFYQKIRDQHNYM